MALGEQVHLEVELLAVSEYLLGMREQQFTLGGEGNVGTHPLEQPRAVLGLELLDVLADGRLAHIQLFRRLGKTEVVGYAAKNF